MPPRMNNISTYLVWWSLVLIWSYRIAKHDFAKVDQLLYSLMRSSVPLWATKITVSFASVSPPRNPPQPPKPLALCNFEFSILVRQVPTALLIDHSLHASKQFCISTFYCDRHVVPAPSSKHPLRSAPRPLSRTQNPNSLLLFELTTRTEVHTPSITVDLQSLAVWPTHRIRYYSQVFV